MTLAEIRDWLKSFDAAENYYCGRLENKKEKSLGVYSCKRYGLPSYAIEEKNHAAYSIKSVSLLLHWNQDAGESKDAAGRLWHSLFGNATVSVPAHLHIKYVQPNVPAPVYVGTDSSGVHEYVIEVKIYLLFPAICGIL